MDDNKLRSSIDFEYLRCDNYLKTSRRRIEAGLLLVSIIGGALFFTLAALCLMIPTNYINVMWFLLFIVIYIIFSMGLLFLTIDDFRTYRVLKVHRRDMQEFERFLLHESALTNNEIDAVFTLFSSYRDVKASYQEKVDKAMCEIESETQE